ncbi:MAG: agmatine deiminase family protein [Bacteroidota bacterium]|nr:agmatine deiminase family protein [Bacteroidota bacterium]
MQKILFFLLFSSIAYAQYLPKGLAPNEREKGFLKSLGITENPNQKNTSSATIYTTPPSEEVRTMAEWEEIQALTITWSTNYNIQEETILSQIVANAVQECQVIIICEEESEVESYLLNQGISIENVNFIKTNFNNIWIRDYGQNTVYKNEVGEAILVDWIYNRNRPYDDLVPEKVAEYFNMNMHNTTQAPWDLMATGGNFMSDGMGTAFSSELIVDENSGGYAWEGFDGNVYYPNNTLEEINNILKEFMGIDNYIIMENLPYDGIHHIDMHMKLLNEETLLIAEYPEGVADGPQIEANIQYVLENFNSAFGTPYDVIRIPSPPSSSGNYPDNNGYYRTYTNSVFINNTVLVPFYRTEYDTIAQRIYEQALPGYNIVGIDVDNQGENLISYSGAIHCITHSVGVNEPLLIQHQALEDSYPIEQYNVSASIQHQSGIASATLFWTTNLELGYQSLSMTNIDGNNWSAFIEENLSAPNSVYYYIEATANSGKTLSRPLPAPEAYFKFNILEQNNVSLSQNNITNIEMSVYPNPASAITCIPVNCVESFEGQITLINILGKEVTTIYEGNFLSGLNQFFIHANDYAKGIYFIVLDSEQSQIRKRLIIE